MNSALANSAASPEFCVKGEVEYHLGSDRYTREFEFFVKGDAWQVIIDRKLPDSVLPGPKTLPNGKIMEFALPPGRKAGDKIAENQSQRTTMGGESVAEHYQFEQRKSYYLGDPAVAGTNQAARPPRPPGWQNMEKMTLFPGPVLVEMLVVIGIVGLLAALLLPSLGRGKRLAKQTECMNRQRQLTLGWSLYADGHDDRLVPNKNWMGAASPVRTNWVAGAMTVPTEATNTALVMDPRESLLAEYVRDERAYKCPSDRSRLVRSVGMNHWLNPLNDYGMPNFTQGLGTNYVTYRNRSSIRRAESIFVFVDERADSINDAFFVVDRTNTGNILGMGPADPYYIVDYPASYHDGAAVLSFADGHVEAHRWLESTTNPPEGMAVPRIHTSAADRDMEWLQQRATEER